MDSIQVLEIISNQSDLYLKLQELFTKFQIDCLKPYCIAGGSIVYALNSFVPKSSVGDIDVFVNNISDFITIAKLFSKFGIKAIQVCNLPYFNSTTTSDNDELADRGFSIFNFELIGESISFQVIFQDFQTPFDVIKAFDIDYVQCALHQNQVYITNEAKQSHFEKRILKTFESCCEIHRLCKAANKGFETPIFGHISGQSVSDHILKNPNYESFQVLNLKELLELPIVPLNFRPTESPISLENINVEKYSFKRIHNYLHFYRFNLIFNGSTMQQRVETFAITIHIKTFQEYIKPNNSKNRFILIEPLWGIERIHDPNQVLDPQAKIQNVLVQIYSNKSILTFKIKFKAIKNLPSHWKIRPVTDLTNILEYIFISETKPQKLGAKVYYDYLKSKLEEKDCFYSSISQHEKIIYKALATYFYEINTNDVITSAREAIRTFLWDYNKIKGRTDLPLFFLPENISKQIVSENSMLDFMENYRGEITFEPWSVLFSIHNK